MWDVASTKFMLVCADDAHLQSSPSTPRRRNIETQRTGGGNICLPTTGPWVEQCSVSPPEGQTQHVSCDQEHNVYRLPYRGGGRGFHLA